MANQQFEELVRSVASRVPGVAVVPAFFSLASPTIADRVNELRERGAAKVFVLPYFLHAGAHIKTDLPEQLEACRTGQPGLEIELLPTLQGDPALVEILVQRIDSLACGPVPARAEITEGKAIEDESGRIIDAHLRGLGLDLRTHAIVRRVIHSTADLSFATSMRIHPEAAERGIEALRAGEPVICDVKMLQAGLTKVKSEVLCAISDPDVVERAKVSGTTRAAEAMRKLSDRWEGAIVAVGNAPTALWEVLEIAAHGGPRPALVVGLPVGFVGARESKLALWQSGLCHITNLGSRGGSPAAAAAVNALAFWQESQPGSSGDPLSSCRASCPASDS
jgi:precorrin-8X/cobalt-precorrin-8 methylmutase